MVGPPEQNLDARARTMDPPLTSQMQAVGRDLNTVLARFHAVSRQIPSVVTQEDGTLEAVPCSVIESWEVRLDECKLDKQAVVQRLFPPPISSELLRNRSTWIDSHTIPRHRIPIPIP